MVETAGAKELLWWVAKEGMILSSALVLTASLLLPLIGFIS